MWREPSCHHLRADSACHHHPPHPKVWENPAKTSRQTPRLHKWTHSRHKEPPKLPAVLWTPIKTHCFEPLSVGVDCHVDIANSRRMNSLTYGSFVLHHIENQSSSAQRGNMSEGISWSVVRDSKYFWILQWIYLQFVWIHHHPHLEHYHCAFWQVFLRREESGRVGPRSYFLLYVLEANNNSNRKHLLMPIYSLWTSPAYEPALNLNGNFCWWYQIFLGKGKV